jgi:protein SCO1/2
MPARACARRLRAAAVTIGAIAAVTGGCGDDSGPSSLSGVVRQPSLQVGAATLPDVTDSDTGVPFTFRAEPGRLLVAYFGFTNCPDLCPTTLADLRSAKRRIGEDADIVDLAFVTVDPQRDTPEILRNYVGSFTDQFRVLRTLDEAELEAAEQPFLASSSVTKAADGSIDVSHTATAYVVDENGTVLVEWPFGIGSSGMENDLRILLDRLEEQ